MEISGCTFSPLSTWKHSLRWADVVARHEYRGASEGPASGFACAMANAFTRQHHDRPDDRAAGLVVSKPLRPLSFLWPIWPVFETGHFRHSFSAKDLRHFDPNTPARIRPRPKRCNCRKQS